MSEEPEQQPLTGDESDLQPEADTGQADAEPDDDVQDRAPDAEEMPFEEAVEELETIVQELEDGELALEDAMERFERGLGLVEACRGKLERAELKVEELLDDGTTQELDDGR